MQYHVISCNTSQYKSQYNACIENDWKPFRTCWNLHIFPLLSLMLGCFPSRDLEPPRALAPTTSGIANCEGRKGVQRRKPRTWFPMAADAPDWTLKRPMGRWDMIGEHPMLIGGWNDRAMKSPSSPSLSCPLHCRIEMPRHTHFHAFQMCRRQMS